MLYILKLVYTCICLNNLIITSGNSQWDESIEIIDVEDKPVPSLPVPIIKVIQERVAAECPPTESDDWLASPNLTETSLDQPCPDSEDFGSLELGFEDEISNCNPLLKPKSQICFEKINTTFSEEYKNSILGQPKDKLKFQCISPYLTRWSTTILPTKEAKYTDSRRYDQNPFDKENLTFVTEFDLNVVEGNSGWITCESVQYPTIKYGIYVFSQDGKELVGDEDEVEEVRVENLNAYLKVPCAANYPHVEAKLEEESGHFQFQPVNRSRMVAPYDPRSGFVVRGTNESEQTYRCVSSEQSVVYNLFYSNTSQKKLGVSGRVSASVSQILLYTESSLQEHKANNDDKEKRGDIYCQLNVTQNNDVMFLKMIRCTNPNECDWLSVCFQKCWLSHDVERQEITRTSTTAFLNNPFPTGVTLCSLPQENLEIRNYYFTGLDRLSYFISDPVPPNAIIKLETNEQHFYTYQSTVFLCGISTFILVSNIKFAAVFKNKTTLLLDHIDPDGDETILEFGDRGFSQREIMVNLTREMTGIVCMAPHYNSSNWFTSTVAFDSKDVILPSIEQSQTGGRTVDITFRHGEVNQILHCSAVGDPKPEITWIFPNEAIESKVIYPQSIEGESTLIFPTIQDSTFEGIYTCVATSQFGNDTQEMHVTIEDSSLTPQMLAGILCAVLVFLLVFSVIIYFGYKYHAARDEIRDLTEEEIREFEDGILDADEPPVDAKVVGPEEAKHMGFKKSYVIDEKDLIVARDCVLGQGEFGMVYRGFLNGEAVAVKTTKSNADVSYVKAFLAELKIMAYIGDYPHIVHFEGAVVSQIRERIVYCVVELCPVGNLLSYLRKVSDEKLHEADCENYVNVTMDMKIEDVITSQAPEMPRKPRLPRRVHILDKHPSTTTETTKSGKKPYDFVDWCKQIADGMGYLAQKKVIHGDLAARNVLVFKNDVMKITDFGLSRQLYGYSKYVKKHQMPLPWRWMSIESLRYLEFSSQSDVWSFGVTMWEIFSMAETPYPGQSWTLEFVDELSKGMRLQPPKNTPISVYEVMLECWNTEPIDRPTFAQLKQKFESLNKRK